MGRSKHLTRPADTLTELLSATSHHEHDEDRLRRDFSGNPVESYQSDLFLSSPGNEGEILAGGGQWTNIDSSSRGAPPEAMPINHNAHLNDFRGQSTSTHSQYEMSPTTSVLRAADVVTPMIKIPSPSQNSPYQEIETFGWSQQTTSSQSTAGDSQSANFSTGLFQCRRCPKTKKRACDLRYACH